MVKEKESNKWKVVSLILFVFLFLAVILLSISFSNSSEELYKIILKADSDLLEISTDNLKAESYYDEAGYAYEDQDYKKVESNCRLARDYYFMEGQGYKRIKAELKDKEIDDKLIVLYIEKLNLLSEISDNMYEACEHFEVAARYYDTYYNTDVSYEDMSWDMGDGEIEMMNEKITEHDDAVGEYNNNLEEFRLELEKRL